ncbi:hypothetical protein SEA_HOLLOW_60 [Gordonia phage Hollow]|nr:hypothetical protein SEA_HOLLOW_60 [Gordonia phage Hollow]
MTCVALCGTMYYVRLVRTATLRIYRSADLHTNEASKPT